MVKYVVKLFNFFKIRLLKKSIVSVGDGARRALLYYKTDIFIEGKRSNVYKHTNNNEILIICRLLSQFGYSIDIIDRTAELSQIDKLKRNSYDLYISNNAGNCARHDQYILENFDLSVKVGYAAGPEPQKSVEITQKAHDEFIARNRFDKIKVRRLVVYGRLDSSRYEGFDAIFAVANQFSEETYASLYPSIPFHNVYPALSNAISFDLSALASKAANRFFYFGGNGLITKGLDLVLEAFDGQKDLFLDIGGPEDETDFWGFYSPLLARNENNIRFNGFMDIHGDVFNHVCRKTAFVIFASCSEGIATSVLTCQRAGLIPVVTYESGVDIEDFGFMIKRDIGHIKETIQRLSNMPLSEIKARSVKSYLSSLKYSPDGFKTSFEAALLKTLEAKGSI